jgi:hypothetical protein
MKGVTDKQRAVYFKHALSFLGYLQESYSCESDLWKMFEKIYDEVDGLREDVEDGEVFDAEGSYL